VTVNLPSSHPLATVRGQCLYLLQIAWRWLAAGTIGAIIGVPFVSFAVAFVLFHMWLRSFRTAEFYGPYAAKMGAVQIFVTRIAMLALPVFGFWASYGEPEAPYFTAWCGIVVALFIESFFTIKYLTVRETDQ
jgi:hypothetical protein